MSDADQEAVNGADYAVGFRHPPLHTRFKPSVSGNPAGRPKDSKNFKTLLHSILNEQISLQEGSQSRKISKAEAIMRRLIIGALKGDTRDLHALFLLAEQTGQFEELRDEITKIERVIFSTVYEADRADPSSVLPHPVNRPFNRD
jgi:hypothetical protein